MFLQRSITPQQKHGIMICLPKTNAVQTPEGYRLIALLTSDYKLLARILAKRLHPVLEEHLRTSQFCSVPGNSIIETVSIVREAVAHAEVTDTPLYVLTLDFREAFDRIVHYYLFTILELWYKSMVYRRHKGLVWKRNCLDTNKRESGWTHPDTACHKTGLSAEHAVVCIVFASIASHAGKQTTWHPNRAPNAKNSGSSIRRRHNDICDVPDRLQDNIRNNPDL